MDGFVSELPWSDEKSIIDKGITTMVSDGPDKTKGGITGSTTKI